MQRLLSPDKRKYSLNSALKNLAKWSVHEFYTVRKRGKSENKEHTFVKAELFEFISSLCFPSSFYYVKK